MSIVLYHHPWSRAANIVWMLEELKVPYELRWVDLQKGEQKSPEMRALNPMGKLPILVDGAVVMTESAAIGLYLADRYAPGVLAPALDDPQRATYLRWILFTPSVMEPGAAAKQGGWEVRPGAVGWGTYEEMVDTIAVAIGDGPWLLGETFSMADIVFGATLRWLVGFKMIEARPAFVAYLDRLSARPASQEANQINTRIREAHGL